MMTSSSPLTQDPDPLDVWEIKKELMKQNCSRCVWSMFILKSKLLKEQEGKRRYSAEAAQRRRTRVSGKVRKLWLR